MMLHQAVQLSVVIPTWNAPELTVRAIEHLNRDGRPPGVELIVVNDGSDDDTSTLLRSRCPGLEVLDHRENRGFGAAVNTGFMHARGRHLATINNDMLVSWGTLQRLSQFLDSRPRASAVAPQLVDTNVTEQRTDQDWLQAPLSHVSRRSRREGEQSRSCAQSDASYRRTVIRAACVVFNRPALEQVGLFDEQFHLFAEDLDLFHRLTEAGWETWCAPGLTATHFRGLSTRNHENPVLAARFRIQSYRSMSLYYRKHFGWPRASVMRGLLALRLAGRASRCLLARQPGWGHPRGPKEQLRGLSAVLEPCRSRPSEPSLRRTQTSDEGPSVERPVS